MNSPQVLPKQPPLALRIGESLQPALREMKNNLRNKRYT